MSKPPEARNSGVYARIPAILPRHGYGAASAAHEPDSHAERARAFAPGQVYVALSRCTTLYGLVLRRPLRKSDVFVDRRIVRFLTAKAWEAAEAVLPFARRLEIIREAIEKKQALVMTYLKASDVKSHRVVTPESVGEMTYKGKSFTAMLAHCHLRGELRTFRVDRILDLAPAKS